MCECCKEIKFIKEDLIVATDITRKIKAKVITESYRKNNKKPSGIIHFSSYNLNYCPMCGRKLNT